MDQYEFRNVTKLKMYAGLPSKHGKNSEYIRMLENFIKFNHFEMDEII